MANLAKIKENPTKMKGTQMRKKRANKQTIDEVRGRRPATLGSGGGNGGGATEDRRGR